MSAAAQSELPALVEEVLDKTAAAEATPAKAPPPAEAPAKAEPEPPPAPADDASPDVLPGEAVEPPGVDVLVLLESDWKRELAGLGFDIEELEELDLLDPEDPLLEELEPLPL